MVKLELFDIEFSKRSLSFKAGENVKGTVMLRLKERIKLTSLRLIAAGSTRIEWTDGKGAGTRKYHTSDHQLKFELVFFPPPHHSSNDVAATTSEEQPDEKEAANEDEEEHYLEEGDYVYPFSFDLPIDAPPSFENHYGIINYSVKAILCIPWAFDKEVEKRLKVVNHLDIDEFQSLKRPCSLSETAYVGYCCMVGPVLVDMNLDKEGFAVGEAIPVSIKIANQSSHRLTHLSLKLIQIIELVGIHQAEMLQIDPKTHEMKQPSRRSRVVTETVVQAKLDDEIDAKSETRLESSALRVPKNCLHSTRRRSGHHETFFKIGYSVMFCFLDEEIEIPITVGHSGHGMHVEEALVVSSTPPGGDDTTN